MSKEVLITGASGSLGTALLLEAKKREASVLAPTHQEFDITNYEACREFARGKTIDVILHTAALTDWNLCHSDPELALRVNTLGAMNMARIAREHEARLILVSTDAVFQGTPKQNGYREDDIPQSPVSYYGVTKLMGEIAASHIAQPSYLITRLGWLFGPNPAKDVKFVGAILRQLSQGKTTIKVVYDKTGSPTYAIHAAQKLFEYIDQEKGGTRHVVNDGAASRFAVAKELAALWDPQLQVIPVSSDEFPSVVRRPDYSVLASNYPDAQMPHWKTAIREYHEKYALVKEFA